MDLIFRLGSCPHEPNALIKIFLKKIIYFSRRQFFSDLSERFVGHEPRRRSGESIADFIDKIDGIEIRRFLDTESKILREFEDVHLKQIMQDLGVNSANELRIEVELQTILDPCKICQGQIDKFQKIYNAEIKVLSSGAEKTKDLIDLYPKFEVINPKKK